MSRFYEFNNGEAIDLDSIQKVGRVLNKDPYSTIYGGTYEITLSSGVTQEIWESIEGNAPAYGQIIMPRKDMLDLLNGSESI
jgi:hypothetical protein